MNGCEMPVVINSGSGNQGITCSVPVVAYAEKLRKDESKADNVVRQLNRNKKTYQAQLRAKRKEIEALNREIERIIASAMKGGAQTSSGRKKTVVDEKLAAEFARNKGKLP